MLLPAGAVVTLRASTRVLAGAALSVRLAVVDKLLAASVTVRVCGPARIKVTEKVPWPLVSGESAGRVTPLEESLLLKWTVPVYEVTGLPASFSATTVTLNACPEGTVAGAVALTSLIPGWPVGQ